MKRLGLLAISIFFLAGYAFAQNTGTGTPPFGSFTSAPRDTINNQNLNVHVLIPFASIRGRNTNFNFNQSYDSTIWTPVTSGGTTSWAPAVDSSGSATWGWYTLAPTGQTLWTDSWTYYDDCDEIETQNNFSWVDVQGTTHPFPSSIYISTYWSCDGPSFWGNYTGYATDNSGHYINVYDSTVQNTAGLTSYFSGTVNDPNGNAISVTGTAYGPAWTDTTGRGVITTTNYSTYTTYQVPDGYYLADINYQSLSIKTNFACSGVVEYTGSARVPSSIVFINGDTYSFTYEPTPGHSGYYTGRVLKVTLPNGGYYEYDYGSTNDGINCSDGTTVNLTRKIYDGTNTNQWAFVRANSSGWTTTETAPQLSYDSAGNATVYAFDSNGHETSRKVYEGSSSGTLLQTVNTTWASNGTPSAKMTILGTSSTQAETDTSYDSNGILQSLTEYDWGTGTHGSSSPLRTITYSYSHSSDTNYTSQNILGLVTTKTIQDGSGTTKFRQDYTYDGVSLSSCPTGAAQHWDVVYPCSSNYRGNITAIKSYLDPVTPANYITTNFTYDWFGNMLTASVGSTQQMQQSFSSTTHYSTPDSITIGPSGTGLTQLTTSYTYDSTTGLMTASSDPNSQTTSYTYDSSWRPVYITRPDSTGIGYTYDDTYHTVTVTTPIDSSHSTNQVTAKDALGRVVTTTLEDGTPTVYSIVQNQYDALGRLYETSDPYTSSPSYWTQSQFDGLGRQTKAILPDSNQTTFAYSTNTVTATDSTGKARKMKTDAAGRTVAVWEDPSGVDYETDYTYDVMDNLTGVTQGSGGPTRTYTYDALGRLASVTTPEGGTDCFGTYSGSTCQQNGYDTFGNLTSKTDARSVVSSYAYDSLNRLIGIIYALPTGSAVSSMPDTICNPVSGTATSNVCFYYDAGGSSAYAKGKLTSMVDPSGSETYTYDNMGRQTELSKVIGSTTFNTSYTYNRGGDVTEISYPSGRNVYQYYDALGRLCSVGSSGGSCTTSTAYTNSYTYNTAQQVTGFNYGNGVAASLGYSADRLQMTSLSYAKSGTLFGQTYSYSQSSGNNGQITSITDTVDNGRSVAYTFDSLARLSRATTTGSSGYPKWDLQWTYDQYGNRLTQSIPSGSTGCSSITCPTPSVSVSTTTNRITSDSNYSYDASGNLTHDGTNTFVYDAENRATSANSGNATYTYDGNGVRVKKAISSGTTTTYVFSGGKVIAEYEGSGSLSASSPTREYIYSGGQLTAKIEGSATSYYHQDNLSVRLMTNSSGADNGDQGHFPFGEWWYPSTAVTKWQFTTYERDAETSNDYAMARSYVNRLGRFNSPDPMGGDASNPQSLNRYAYVQNDPVNKVDPSGLCAGDGTTFFAPDCCDPFAGACADPGDPCYFSVSCGPCIITCDPGTPIGGGPSSSQTPPPPPPGEPLGDPSGVTGQYGTWDESIPGGPPFGGIFFPSSPTGCTYGGGNCGGVVFGLENGVDISTIYSPAGFRILVLVIDFLARSTSKPQKQNSEKQTRLMNCAKAYYGVGTSATRLTTIVAATPFPKSWVGLPSALGSSSLTNLPSWLSVGSGTAASGSNLFRIGGRMAGPIAIASGVIDAAALTMCTEDYVPDFLYTVAKYDPF